MRGGATVAAVDRAADWDAQWRVEPLDPAVVQAEERTPRWRAQERVVRDRLGGFQGLRAIEIGAGRGLNGLLYARRGATVTLLDESELALEQARQIFEAHGAGFERDVAARDGGAVHGGRARRPRPRSRRPAAGAGVRELRGVARQPRRQPAALQGRAPRAAGAAAPAAGPRPLRVRAAPARPAAVKV